MLFFFILSALWGLSLLGWGRWLQPILPIERSGDRIFLGLYGCLFLIQIIHFFAPIHFYLSVVVLTVGLLGLIKIQHKKSFYFKLIILAAFFAPYIAAPIINFDSGLYHIQHILWNFEGPLFKGLGNVYDRFSFNSNYLLMAAFVFPFPEYSEGFPLLNAIISLPLGFRILDDLLQSIQKKSLDYKSLFNVGLLFIFIYFLRSEAHSPGTDFPIKIGFLYFAHIFFHSDKKNLNLLLLVTALYTSFKLSFAPMFAVVAYLTFRNYKTNALNRYVTVFSVLLLITWLLRNFFLSGCFIFPIAGTCFEVPWVMRIEEVVNTMNWVRSWARMPGVSPEIVLKDYSWLETWFFNNFAARKTLLVVFALTFIWNVFKSGSLRGLFYLNTFNLIVWFYLAPDFRFGNVYIFMNILIALISFSKTFTILYSKHPLLLVLLASPLLISHWDAYIKQGNWFLERNLPAPKTEIKYESSGFNFKVPKINEQCWDAQPPCAPTPYQTGVKGTRSSFEYFYRKL